MMKTWLITGASSGFGRALAEQVLERGDQVVLAARRLAPLEELAVNAEGRAMPVAADVMLAADRSRLVRLAVERFGRIDVLANIAGRGCLGAAEEFSLEQLREQMELNFFSAVELTREVLPVMRAQGSGHLLNLTSVAGLVAFPACAPYCASKFALEAWSEALSFEMSSLGIRVTLVEPGAFRTEFAGGALLQAEGDMVEYRSMVSSLRSYFDETDGNQLGDPAKAARLMQEVVDAEIPPLRLVMGADAYANLDATLAARMAEFAAWRERGVDTAFKDAVDVQAPLPNR